MKIVLFSSGMNNYDLSIKRYLNNNGHKVGHYSYRSKLYSSDFFTRLKHKIYFKINNNYESNDWNACLIKKCKEFNPDLVFILKGEIIYPETLKWIRDNTDAKIICWLMDVVKRFPQIERLLKYYDYMFSYSSDDIDFLRSFNPETHYLPVGYDPKVFFKMDDIKKKWDLSFIGTWSRNREDFLIKVSKLLEKESLDIVFYLNNYSLFRPSTWRKWLKRKSLYKFFKNHSYFSLSEMNILFNQSKVCLNIHQDFTQNALNTRTFEILGSGAYQLIENFDSTLELLKNDSTIIRYNGPEDLVKRLKEILINFENKKYVNDNHTFEHRLSQLFEIINLDSN
jgi:spore maturation protein CgeB